MKYITTALMIAAVTLASMPTVAIACKILGYNDASITVLKTFGVVMGW